ncbi:hypothetical protein Mapa_002928 [Marchantia paleacea]|nr:hypothetical protein Mapa_002928 [Marchantia paleacea]
MHCSLLFQRHAMLCFLLYLPFHLTSGATTISTQSTSFYPVGHTNLEPSLSFPLPSLLFRCLPRVLPGYGWLSPSTDSVGFPACTTARLITSSSARSSVCILSGPERGF